ncbi:transposase [Flavilitoribacter nigricans]|uniref:Transposase n=1 Tax=Flavilitoribacter nigricans (strain ATCC 23147 / DSM 23189 / NBRC 102662 / NCIMB 1420 / SS-2) TaxID=1122177 RepID=A0A2D0N8F0_FLAN2|nr:transposase [Flavilitoribacter nigricans]PHN04757.1 transposase [Flavilitoribacter nigricans DSM 23189 = NBRC 102662]
MKSFQFLLGTFVLVFSLTSCSSEVERDQDTDSIKIEIKADTDEIKKDIDDGMDDLNEGLSEMTSGLAKMVESFTTNDQGENIPAADFRDLKAILPDRLLRMDRIEHTGERSGVKGLQVSVAEAKYEDDDRYLEVALVDGGSLPLAGLANMGWSMAEVDKETKNGYERTTVIDGHKAFEKYNSRWEEGELVVLYQDRFIITLKGKGIDADDLRRALNKIDLDELEEL